MTGFNGYLCWTRADAEALPTEAVVATRAMFFATHAPLKIHRSDPSGRRGTGEVTEDMVRKDFLSRNAPGGVLLMPVIGESGTGKSHLVRWVMERTPPTDRRQVIYLKKSETSLKAVVRALLAQVKSSDLDQLRADVDKMSSGLDQAALEQALINRLQEALAAAPQERGPARDLYGKDGLQVLLQDPYVSNHLRRPGALIPLLAKSILNDRDKDEKDRPLEFTVEDLPLDILEADKKAAEVTRYMLELLGVDADLQVAAVRLLNTHLQTAVANATVGGVGRLQEAMLDVRREYARQGKEIVLLIEDFAVIQGFQRDLLDAIIEVGERHGKNDLAPIRTLMAVTTGYYESLPDTVRTRAQAATGYVYDLDAQFAPMERMGEISSFVGRYLNAARLGRERVEKHGEQKGTQVPNACEECGFRQQCHSAFGSSEEGHGLYPFNEPALRRAIHARPVPGEKPGAFNPRVVVGEVVKNVLVEHADAIAEARFPDPRFADEYRTQWPADPKYAEIRERRLPQAVRAAINQLDPGDTDRHATFLEFWGDAPGEAVNLPEGMHEAFEIKRLDVKEVGRTRGRPAKADPAHGRTAGTGSIDGPPTPDDLPASVKRRIEQVESWAAGETTLNQTTANEIRAIIRDAVIERCAWNRPLMPEPTNEVLQRSWPVGSAVVSIQGAFGEREATGSAPIQFTPSPENALFFEGLLLRVKAGRIQESAAAWRRLAGYADRHQGSLQKQTQRYLEVTDEQLSLGVRASLIGATLAGKAMPGMREAELLAVVFDEGRDWILGDVESRAQVWRTVLQKHLEARSGLIGGLRSGFGVSRGIRGAARMIDAARALPMLRQAVREWHWSTPATGVAPWIKNAVNGFADWEGLLDAQLDAHHGLLAGVRQFLPQGTSLGETIEAVSTAVREAREAGADDQSPDKYLHLQSLIEKVKQQDRRAVDRLESDLAVAVESGKGDRARILAAARDRGEDVVTIRDFLAAGNEWLTNALKVAKMQESGKQSAAEAEVRELLSRWAAIGGEN